MWSPGSSFEKALWPSDVFVDYETGLNTAVRKLRRALNDDAGQVRYVETLPRNGYRFIAPVQRITATPTVEIVSPGQPVVSNHDTPPKLPTSWRWIGWTVGAAALAAAILIAWRSSLKPVDLPVLRSTIELPSDQVLAGLRGNVVALSPDGQTLAYIAQRPSSDRELFLRRLDSKESSVIATKVYGGISFSPDGEELFYFGSPRGLFRLRLRDRTRQEIPWEAHHTGASLTWGPKQLYFAQKNWDPEARGLPLDGVWKWENGEAQPLDWKASQLPKWQFPTAATPDGRYVFVTRNRGPRDLEITAIDTATGSSRLIAKEARSLRLLPTGHAVFFRDDTIFGVEIDPDTASFIGTPIPLVPDVRLVGWVGGDFDVSLNGTLAYVPVPPKGDARMIWMDRQGRVSDVPVAPGPYRALDISPDGEKILYTREDSGQRSHSLWAVDVRRATTGSLLRKWPEIPEPSGVRIATGSPSMRICPPTDR